MPLRGIINNVTMAYDNMVSNLNADRLRAMPYVNVFAPMRITKYAIRRMLFDRFAGSIVDIYYVNVHRLHRVGDVASIKEAL